GYERMQWWRPGFVIKFAFNFRCWLEDFLKTNSRDRREFVSRKARAWRRKIARKLFRKETGPEQVDLEEVIDLTKFPKHELRLWQLHLNAAVVHVSRPYPGRVTLFRTKGQPLFCSLEDDFRWGRLVGGGVDIRLVPGSHESIFMEPDVRHLAAELNACLDSAGEPLA
ncbi:MAG TPA: non-ribosomal peptide synthetase, partial [Verrucomicrobiae bacterium]|nr:non-ribosomal peptide synthetase [Verrucomicrobiae bacterium]